MRTASASKRCCPNLKGKPVRIARDCLEAIPSTGPASGAPLLLLLADLKALRAVPEAFSLAPGSLRLATGDMASWAFQNPKR